MTKTTMQMTVAGIIVAVWIGAGIVALFDGKTMLRIATPAAMVVFGWLFTEKATTA